MDDVSLSADISNWDNPSNYPALEITKGLLHNYLAASDASFKAFFAPGVYAYAKEDGGFRIYYQYKSGVEWTSFDGSGAQ